MNKSSSNILDSLSEEIKAQANDLRDDNLRSLILTSDIVQQYVDVMLHRDRFNRTEMYILNTLIIHGGSMNPSEIARRVYRSPHAITRAVDKLEQKGHVHREPIGEDRRTRKVSITQEGLRAIKQSLPRRKQVNNAVMSCLDQTQMEQLSTILELLRKHLRRQVDELSR
jgi:MarR family 2-MHQ and catechol resistance regulon transcriptional repressor